LAVVAAGFNDFRKVVMKFLAMLVLNWVRRSAMAFNGRQWRGCAKWPFQHKRNEC